VSRTRDFSKLINGFAADKIISGTLDAARLSNIDSDYIQLRQASADLSTIDSDYIQLRQATADLTNLNADNLTSGTIPNARVSSGSVTQHVSAVNVNVGSWSPGTSNFSATFYNSDYVRVGRLVHVTTYYKITGYTNTSSLAYMSGLPYTSNGSGNPQGTGYVNGGEINNMSYGCFVHGNSNAIYFRGGFGKKSLSHADYQGTLRGSDFQYMSTVFRGANDAFHLLTLTYISNS